MKGNPAGFRWSSIALGWAVAVGVGFTVDPFLRTAYALASDCSPGRNALARPVVVVSMASGFLAYLGGGYVAARIYRISGGRNGAMAAILGLISGTGLAVLLWLFDATLPGAAVLPPANFGWTGRAFPPSVVLFCVNLFGGYVGGKLGEPPPNAEHP